MAALTRSTERPREWLIQARPTNMKTLPGTYRARIDLPHTEAAGQKGLGAPHPRNSSHQKPACAK